ncbi:MAG: hypothetical protein BAJALOKI1v1_540018 [Promethearchaeota archaeon]|nr:MAG: hypothetical protein BAJALOKI1v1_540018 [Candidatus Lokiarchaeota archaeon]
MTLSSELVEIVCPECKATKKVALPMDILNQNKFRLIKMQVSEKICKHTFIVFFDPNTRKIVGAQKIDITFKVSSEEFKILEQSFSLKGLIYLFGIYGTMCLFHANIFNYSVRIFSTSFPEEYLEVIQNYFIQKINQNNHSFSISKLDDFYFLKPYVLTSLFADTLILDSDKNILNTPWESDLNFEIDLLRNALSIKDQKKQLEMISDEIELLLIELNLVTKTLKKQPPLKKEELPTYIEKHFQTSLIYKYGTTLLEEYIKKTNQSELLL